MLPRRQAGNRTSDTLNPWWEWGGGARPCGPARCGAWGPACCSSSSPACWRSLNTTLCYSPALGILARTAGLLHTQSPNLAVRRRRSPSASNPPPRRRMHLPWGSGSPPSVSCTQEARASPTRHLSLQVSEEHTLTLKWCPPGTPRGRAPDTKAAETCSLEQGSQGMGSEEQLHACARKEARAAWGRGADSRVGCTAVRPCGAGLRLCLGHGSVPPVLPPICRGSALLCQGCPDAGGRMERRGWARPCGLSG